MKYRLLALFFLCFLPLALTAGEADFAPQYTERHMGHADLSRGLFYRPPQDPLPEAVTALLVEVGATATGTPPRRGVVLELIQAEAIPVISTPTANAYRMVVSSSRIRIEYTSLRAVIAALRELTALRDEQPTSRRRRIPAGEVRGWIAASQATVYRLTVTPFRSPQALEAEILGAIPPTATEVELPLTSPDNGWLLPGEVLQTIDFAVPTDTRHYYTYGQLNELSKTFSRYGLNLVPLFDLTAKNPHFEATVGHALLSVEGMRFVRMLLEEFLAHTAFPAVAFVVPEGVYRDQIARIVAQYPSVSARYYK
ncbi:MAG: hypothetical protein LBM20_02520 [Rikenellaceae bacterium]|nr:hypothetical protein [Rikenellaceae bacterium]